MNWTSRYTVGKRFKRKASNQFPECMCVVVFSGDRFVIMKDEKGKEHLLSGSFSDSQIYSEIPTLENK